MVDGIVKYYVAFISWPLDGCCHQSVFKLFSLISDAVHRNVWLEIPSHRVATITRYQKNKCPIFKNFSPRLCLGKLNSFSFPLKNETFQLHFQTTLFMIRLVLRSHFMTPGELKAVIAYGANFRIHIEQFTREKNRKNRNLHASKYYFFWRGRGRVREYQYENAPKNVPKKYGFPFLSPVQTFTCMIAPSWVIFCRTTPRSTFQLNFRKVFFLSSY